MTDLVFYLVVFLAIGVFFLAFHLLIGKLIRPYRPDAEKMTIYECGEPTVGSAWIQFDLRYYVVALLFVIFDVEVAFFFPWAVVFGKANEISRLPGSAQELNTAVKRLDEIEVELKNASLAADEKKKLTDEKERQTAEAERLRAELESSRPERARITNELVPANLNLAYLETARAPPKKKGMVVKKGAPFIVEPVGPGGMVSPTPTTQAPKDVEPIAPDTARTWAWIAFGDIMVFFGVLMVGFAYLWRRGDIDWVRSTAAEQTEPPVPA